MAGMITFLLLLVTSEARAAEHDTVASCYGEELAGNLTASGEVFDPNDFTTAHRWLPFGTLVLIRNRESWVVVRVTDRGPFVWDREFDLSCGAMRAMGLPPGVYPVTVTEL